MLVESNKVIVIIAVSLFFVSCSREGAMTGGPLEAAEDAGGKDVFQGKLGNFGVGIRKREEVPILSLKVRLGLYL